jgi:hypothetical protein
LVSFGSAFGQFWVGVWSVVGRWSAGVLPICSEVCKALFDALGKLARNSGTKDGQLDDLSQTLGSCVSVAMMQIETPKHI